MNRRTESASRCDVLIVGAGPIGLQMGTVLRDSGLSVRHVERGAIGATLCWWPRNTIFFSSPEWIAISGIPIQTAAQEQVSVELYLAYLRQVVEITGITVETWTEVTDIRATQDGTHLVSLRGVYSREEQILEARSVVLATGDLHEPLRLGVPGEDLPHVSHYFTDPHRFFQTELLIVGGRNSAIEAAIRCWRAGARVTLAYRGERIPENRVISRLFLEFRLLVENAQVSFLPRTEVREIRPGVAVLSGPDGTVHRRADFVLLATGFRPNPALMQAAGLELEPGTHRPVLDSRTMESSVPGIYVAGTATAGHQRAFTTFITTAHEHCLKIARALTGDSDFTAPVGNVAIRNYRLESRDIE